MSIESIILAGSLKLNQPKIIQPNKSLKVAQIDTFRPPPNTEYYVRDLAKTLSGAFGCGYTKEVLVGRTQTNHIITCHRFGIDDRHIQDILSSLNRIGEISNLPFNINFTPITLYHNNTYTPAKFTFSLLNHR